MSTPAGWYPDTTNPEQMRYWDGAQWTEHTAPGTTTGQTTLTGPSSNVGRQRRLTRVLLVVIVLTIAGTIAAVAAGSSGHNPSTISQSPSPVPEQTDVASVDAAIDKAGEATRTLIHLTGTSSDLSAQYQLAAGDLDQVAATLRPAPAGVPESVARGVASAAGVEASGLRATISCLDSGGDCSATTKIVQADARDLGSKIADLIPYGSRSQSEVLALFS